MALKQLQSRIKVPRLARLRKSRASRSTAGAKFVLFIGDEGAILIYIKDNVVQNRQFVPDAGEQNLSELKNSLAADPKAPIMMVIDTLDQTYVQQTLPPVSSLSVSKLIKRRLERDFGANDIKGAIILGRETSGRKDWNFLMVGLEKSPQLTVWLDFISSQPNRFQGIYLVSAEAEIIVKDLRRAIDGEDTGPGAQWTFFVSHNKVGGFRQVILKNGKLIFTRMAQPIGESTPEVIAGSIEQEMLSTIEYMRRLSFNPQDGLDIYIIASTAIKTAIDANKFEANQFRILTPYEVAQYLAIEGATQPTDQFGDVVLAAGIGCSRKHVLTLSTLSVQQFDQMYAILKAQRAAAALIGLGLLGYAGMTGFDMVTTYMETNDLETNRLAQQKALEQLQQEIKDSKLDVEKTNDVIDLYQQLLQEKLSPLPVIAALSNTLKPPVVVKGIEWTLDDKPAQSAPAAPPEPGTQGTPKMTAQITMEFPMETNVEAFRNATKSLLNELKTVFKGYDVSYTHMPAGYSENEKMDMAFGNETAAAPSSGVLEVQLTIKGDALMAMPKLELPHENQ